VNGFQKYFITEGKKDCGLMTEKEFIVKNQKPFKPLDTTV
jgi:hypothetical protein